MISVYEYQDYRQFLGAWLKQSNKRGLQGQLAAAMKISTSLMSLVLRGEKNLSGDQACEAIDFLQLNEKESDFFLMLVELGQSGSSKMQSRLKKKISEAQSQARKINNRVRKDAEISEEAKAIYYSSWTYPGIRNLVAVPGFQTAAALSQKLGLPMPLILKILDFLVEQGLCVKNDQGYSYGPANLHIGVDSPHANRNHQNWRHKAIAKMDQRQESDLFYTGTLSLSVQDAEVVRNEILKTIDTVLKIVRPSPSECVRTLNLDFFEY